MTERASPRPSAGSAELGTDQRVYSVSKAATLDGWRRRLRALCGWVHNKCRPSVLVDLVLGTTGQDLFLAPTGDVFERLTVNEVLERLFV